MRDTEHKKFYMTYSGRTYPNDIAPWVEEHNVPIMTNANIRWSEAQEDFLDPFEYDTERCIDSSGYNSQGDYVDRWGNLKVEERVVEGELETGSPFFPWTIEQYHDWLQENKNQFSWAATMDYACEERFNTLWSVEERIEHTIENTITQFEMGPEYKLVPVLQGRSVEDYIYCYEQLKEANVEIPLDTIGLGTVCRISSETKLVEMENEARKRLPDGITIHGFGVKVNAFKLGAKFDTADSQAWIYGPSNGRVMLLKRDGNGGLAMDEKQSDNARERSLETFKTYYAYVSHIMNGKSGVDVDSVINGQKEI